MGEIETKAVAFLLENYTTYLFICIGIYIGWRKLKVNKYLSQLFDWYSERLTPEKLLKSDLFLGEQSLRDTIKMLSFDCPKKTELAKLLLTCKLDSILQGARALIFTENLRKLDKVEISKLFSSNIDTIVSSCTGYEKTIPNTFFQYYRKKDITEKQARKKADVIFSIMYQDPRYGFRKLHNDNITLLYMFIKKTSLSKESNIHLAAHLVTLYHCAIDSAIIDVEKAFDLLNGRLSSEL